MVSYLIPYVDPKRIEGHEDPLLEEFTYGDVGQRGKMLREKVGKRDFLFFHTNRKGKHVITAYYLVEKVMLTYDAKRDELITSKYRNPHLCREESYDYDTIVLGNPIYSKVLKHPFLIDKKMLNKLSGKPKSIYRPWVKLSNEDVKFLINEINKYEKQNFLKDTLLSSNEVEQLQEEDIEGFIESNSQRLDKSLSAFKRQYVLKSRERVDLLLQSKDGLVVVEIKKGAIGKETFTQVARYLREIKNEFKCKVRGVIVCSDILPAFEDFFARKLEEDDIKIYLYSWRFNLRPIQLARRK